MPLSSLTLFSRRSVEPGETGTSEAGGFGFFNDDSGAVGRQPFGFERKKNIKWISVT